MYPGPSLAVFINNGILSVLGYWIRITIYAEFLVIGLVIETNIFIFNYLYIFGT